MLQGPRVVRGLAWVSRGAGREEVCTRMGSRRGSMGRGTIRIQTIRAAVSFQEKEVRYAPRLNSRIQGSKATAKTCKRSHAEYMFASSSAVNGQLGDRLTTARVSSRRQQEDQIVERRARSSPILSPDGISRNQISLRLRRLTRAHRNLSPRPHHRLAWSDLIHPPPKSVYKYGRSSPPFVLIPISCRRHVLFFSELGKGGGLVRHSFSFLVQISGPAPWGARGVCVARRSQNGEARCLCLDGAKRARVGVLS